MADVRAAMEVVMRQTLADNKLHNNWSYWFVRPLKVPPRPIVLGKPVHSDCSKGCQFIAWWAFGPDPMGLDFADWGNSSTMCHHLQHLDSPKELLVGDYVTMGKDGSEHATCVLEADPINGNPLLWSDGHQGAPNTYHYNDDKRVKQCLRNPIVYHPTPQDKLKAKKGYFAWIAWKLGEGDWYHHTPGDPKVRPLVPRIIPPLWWKRYALFIANRNRGNKAAG